MKTFLLILFCAFTAQAQFGLRSPGFVSKLNQAAPAAPPGGYFQGLVTTNGLISYWRMNEVSDGSGAVTRIDSWSGYNLTDNGNTASDAGIITNAADFEDSSTKYFSRADNAELSLGTNVSFSISAWCKLESKPAVASILMAKDSGVSDGREYYLGYSTSLDRFQFLLGRDNLTTSDACNSTNSGAISTNVWYFVVATWDTSLNRMSISVNAGAADVNGSKNTDPPDSTTAINIGRRGVGDFHFDGLIDEVSFWKNRVLSTNDVSNLYNGGAGLDLGSP